MSERVDWRAVAFATGAGDRGAAEAGVRLAYRQAGLAEPGSVVWVDSPLAAVRLLTGDAAADAGASVRGAVRDATVAARRERLHGRLGPTGWSARWRSTGADLWEATAPLVDLVRAAVVGELAPGGPEPRLRELLLDAVLGPHDAAWLAALEPEPEPAARSGPGQATESGAEPGSALDGLAAVARSAGWWWPRERIAVVSDRPTALHRDGAGRLDRADGPALAYADGFALHAWRGLPVPSGFLDGLGSLTPERLREEKGTELLRILLERYGYGRYLSEAGARPTHRDGSGTLWKIELPGEETLAVVERPDAAPGPDGTHGATWLRVSPGERFTRVAVARALGPRHGARARGART